MRNIIKSYTQSLSLLSNQHNILSNANKFTFITSNIKQKKISLALLPNQQLFGINKCHLNLLNLNKYKFCNKKQEKKDESNEKQQHPQELPLQTFQQLIQINTQDSLIQAHRRLVTLQEKTVKYQQQINQLNKTLAFFQKHEKDNLDKENILKQNIKNQQQQILRVQKRVQKQMKDSKDFAVTKIAKQLLEVADCISRCKNLAVQQFPQKNSRDQYVQKLIQTKQIMMKMFARYQIQEFDPTGKPYDANTQESLLQIPCPPGYVSGTVATVMQTGYMIKGRLLRNARVGIFS